MIELDLPKFPSRRVDIPIRLPESYWEQPEALVGVGDYIAIRGVEKYNTENAFEGIFRFPLDVDTGTIFYGKSKLSYIGNLRDESSEMRVVSQIKATLESNYVYYFDGIVSSNNNPVEIHTAITSKGDIFHNISLGDEPSREFKHIPHAMEDFINDVRSSRHPIDPSEDPISDYLK